MWLEWLIIISGRTEALAMKAIMLAAGEGTRCYPFTYLCPKIWQQVGGIPLLEYMLSWFGGAPDIEKLYIVARNGSTVGTLRDYIQKRKSYLAEIVGLFGRLGYKVEYTNPELEIEVIEANGWGTGGDLRHALDEITSAGELGEDFLVCNADYIINRKLPDGEISLQLNLSDIIEYHQRCKEALATVMTAAFIVVAREEATRFGVGQLEEVNGFKIVRGFAEKPDIKDIAEEPPINAGVCLLDSGFVLSNIDEFLPNKPGTSLERNLMERIAREEKPMLAAYLLDLCAWFDVGTLEQLINVNIYIASRKGARR
jgi:NDP-sugar pyrophosphorylase family protein